MHVRERETNAKEKALPEILHVECRKMFFNYPDSASLCIYGIFVFAIWCLWTEIKDGVWPYIIFIAQFTFLVVSSMAGCY